MDATIACRSYPFIKVDHPYHYGKNYRANPDSQIIICCN
jgi:hypothetical protein